MKSFKEWLNEEMSSDTHSIIDGLNRGKHAMSLNWLRSLTKPTDFREYSRRGSALKELYYDAVLTINTNSNMPNIRVKFKHVHPISLSGIKFSVADTAAITPTAEIAFRYDSFEFDRLGE